MRIGSLVYSTEQGLGILAKSFWDHGVLTDVLVVRHSSRKGNPDWFPGASVARPSEVNRKGRELVDRVDAMLFFETPFDWSLLSYCKAKGVRTALMVMHECMPRDLPHLPDLILAPSLLDQRTYPGSTFLPVPVEVPWKLRTEAKVFVHNAGHGGLMGRNGTKELLAALPLVKSEASFIIRSQEPIGGFSLPCPRVRVQEGTLPYSSLYELGDVFIFPERFNGLSLPLQEAYASGMMVMSTDRFPMNTWLPREPLIPSVGSVRNSVSSRCNSFDEAVVEPQEIAETIDAWHGRDVSSFSLRGKRWAEEHSWEVLGPKYRKVLENLAGGAT